MSDGLTSMAEGLNRVFTRVPDGENLLRQNPAQVLRDQVGFNIDAAVVAKFGDLQQEVIDKIVDDLKLVARYQSLGPNEQRTVLQRLVPFFESFVAFEEDPGKDRPNW